MTEPVEARLARIEEKLDGIVDRLSERWAGAVTRIDSHEKTLSRFGERIGKLEAAEDRRKGGKAVVMGLLAGGAAIGGLGVKMIEALGRFL